MTIIKKLSLAVSVLAIAGMAFASIPAEAGVYDWFRSTPLNQEAQAVKGIEVKKVELSSAQQKEFEARKESAFLKFFSRLFGGSSSNVKSISSCALGDFPWIKFVTPNGGESYLEGDNITVKWESCNMSEDVLIHFTPFYGPNLDQPITAPIPGVTSLNTGLASFVMPVGYIPAEGWQYGANFKMFAKTNNALYNGQLVGVDAFSDDYFKIAQSTSQPTLSCAPGDEPWIEVLTPNGGESYAAGEQITVKWESCNIPEGEQISIGQNWPGSWQLNFGLASLSTVNDGVESYTLQGPNTFYSPGGFQYGAYYKIVVTAPSVEVNNISVFDRSDNVFKIYQPSNPTPNPSAQCDESGVDVYVTPLPNSAITPSVSSTQEFNVLSFLVKNETGCDIELMNLRLDHMSTNGGFFFETIRVEDASSGDHLTGEVPVGDLDRGDVILLEITDYQIEDGDQQELYVFVEDTDNLPSNANDGISVWGTSNYLSMMLGLPAVNMIEYSFVPTGDVNMYNSSSNLWGEILTISQ
jgi:hypothetical protein